MDVLTIRVRIAASDPPIVIAGKTKWARLPDPETGKSPREIENIRIRIGPSAKFGKDSPKRLTTLKTLSSHLPRRCAERTPAGIEITRATINDATVNCKVYG